MVPVTVGDRERFTETIRAMEWFPTANREEDMEFAEALRLTEEVHVPSDVNADRNRKYGPCLGCGELWPCRVWNEVARSATDWLLYASQDVLRRSWERIARAKTGELPGPCLGEQRRWAIHDQAECDREKVFWSEWEGGRGTVGSQ